MLDHEKLDVYKTSIKDKRRYYSIARGSAMECAAIIDVCEVIHAKNNETLTQGKALLTRIVSMLTKLCRK